MADNTNEKTQFHAILQITVASLVEMIKKSENIDEKDAMKNLCESKLYKTLENEETKLWRLSVPELFSLYIEEKKTDGIAFSD